MGPRQEKKNISFFRPRLENKKNFSFSWTPVVKMVRRRRRPSRLCPLVRCSKSDDYSPSTLVTFALERYLREQYMGFHRENLLGLTPKKTRRDLASYMREVDLALFLSNRTTFGEVASEEGKSAPISHLVTYSINKVPKKTWVSLLMELMKQFGPELFNMVIIFQSAIWQQIVRPTQAEPLTEEFVLTGLVQVFELATASNSTADEVLTAVVHKCVSTYPKIKTKDKPSLPAAPLTEEVVLALLVQEFGLAIASSAADEILTAVVHKWALTFDLLAHDDAN